MEKKHKHELLRAICLAIAPERKSSSFMIDARYIEKKTAADNRYREFSRNISFEYADVLERFKKSAENITEFYFKYAPKYIENLIKGLCEEYT